MKYVLIATPVSKDILAFNGVLDGKPVADVFVCNRTFEEGKTYMVAFDEYERLEGAGSIIVNIEKCKEL